MTINITDVDETPVVSVVTSGTERRTKRTATESPGGLFHAVVDEEDKSGLIVWSLSGADSGSFDDWLKRCN